MSPIQRRHSDRACAVTARLVLAAVAVAGNRVSAAHAQDEIKKAAPRQRVYVSQYTGITALGSSDLRLIQPRLGTDATYSGVNYEGKPLAGSPYYGFKVGYFLPKSSRVGFEFEYNHTKMYAKVGESKLLSGTWQGQTVSATERLSDRIQRYYIANGINGISLNVIYRVPVSVNEKYPDGRLQPYVGGGPQYTYLYSINTVGGLRAKEKYHPNGWGYQLFGGVRYLTTPRFGLFAEGKYQHGDAVSLIADQGDAEGGRGVTDIRIVQLAGGVFYQF
ncbi:MAG: outer membrane beta-barrel protein [Akkermansiaceae bacterium]|nr:outer membrane beta-barrel protein [Armatimonadota bacterium]